jgi:hypothetical protein
MQSEKKSWNAEIDLQQPDSSNNEEDVAEKIHGRLHTFRHGVDA